YSRLSLATAAPEVKRQLALDILTEAYRTRRSYMNHWRAIWTDDTPRVAKEFSEPSWSRATPGPHPWEGEGPPSHAEVEGRFRREIASLPALAPVLEPSFSKQLVRVRLDGPWKKSAEKTTFTLVNAERFALSSDAGEPLEFTVKTGLIAAYL